MTGHQSKELMMRRTLIVLAAALVVAALAAPATAGNKWQATAAGATPRDWSDRVDFTKTGLDKTNPADAALLMMTEPERVKNPTDRAAYQRQLDGLVAAQTKTRAASKARGLTAAQTDAAVLSVASPQLVAADTIDPGCQLTSSTPDGLDLCGYDSAGDTMSAFGSGRKHKMWAGVQESDTQGSANAWRAWYKSQAYGLSSDNVDHVVNVNQFQAWSSNNNGTGGTILGESDPPSQGPCSPCYKVGTFRSWSSGKRYADYFQRTFVSITDTNDNSSTLNAYCSGWWNRDLGASQWPGVYNTVCPGL